MSVFQRGKRRASTQSTGLGKEPLKGPEKGNKSSSGRRLMEKEMTLMELLRFVLNHQTKQL
jgi:hypothetical protein